MREFLDANVIIRYLTDDPPLQAERAAALIEGPRELTVSPLILAEVGYVLTQVYRRERAVVVPAMIEFVQRENIAVYQMTVEIVVEALEWCRPNRAVSFADALLWAEARTAVGAVHTFDERFPQREVPVLRP